MWYGVWVDVQVGERSEVLKSMRALGVSGSRDSGVWGFPILRECLVIRSRGTSAPQGWRWCRYLRGVGGCRCRIGDEVLRGGADADFVGGASVIMPIGVASVSG